MFKALTLVALLSIPTLASAESCGPRDVVTNNLATKYGESQTAVMLNNRGLLIEVYSNETTGTWTFLVSAPSTPELVCLLDDGQAFALVEPTPQGSLN